jgi:hypothetical protein
MTDVLERASVLDPSGEAASAAHNPLSQAGHIETTAAQPRRKLRTAICKHRAEASRSTRCMGDPVLESAFFCENSSNSHIPEFLKQSWSFRELDCAIASHFDDC